LFEVLLSVYVQFTVIDEFAAGDGGVILTPVTEFTSA
jgi:hypothetical protein